MSASSSGPPSGPATPSVPQSGAQSGAQSPTYKLALIANYDGNININSAFVNPNSIVLNKFYGVATEMNPFGWGRVITTAGDYSTTNPHTTQLEDVDNVNPAFEPFETDSNNVDYDGKIARYTTNVNSNIKSQDFTNKSVIIIYLRAKKGVNGKWNTVKSNDSAEDANVIINSADVNNRIYITDANAAVLKTDKTVDDPNKKYYQIRIINNNVKIYKDGILVKYALTGEVKTTLAYLLKSLLNADLTFDGENVIDPKEPDTLGNKTGLSGVNYGGKKSKKHRKKGNKKSKKRRSMRRLKRSRARK